MKNLTRDDMIKIVEDWMRHWAPEVQKRLGEQGEAPFIEVRQAYEEMRSEPSEANIERAYIDVLTCANILRDAPPGTYDYLCMIGTHIP